QAPAGCGPQGRGFRPAGHLHLQAGHPRPGLRDGIRRLRAGSGPDHRTQLVLHPNPAERGGRLMSTRTKRRILGGVAVVVALVWAFPVYWMVNSSLLPTAKLESFTPTF